ncbi:MAG TPA: DUF3618 domain-containing protein [Allosphingosinicella sp.]|nr:DUF3618 domain-containing protein [Allosphingosinicella sp.]
MNAELEQAKLEAERARKRLVATLDEIEEKLTPGALADHAWSGVIEKGSEIAEEAVAAVKSRPATTAGVIAGFALFLARGRIVSAASRLVSRKGKGGKRTD